MVLVLACARRVPRTIHAMKRAASDPRARAVILTGAGRAFSTGFDLGGEDFEMDAEQWREDIAANMRRLRKPDPYHQKGVRYTGEVLKKKAGKTGA